MNNRMVKKISRFQAKIENSQSFPRPGDSDLIITEDSGKIVNAEDNEDILIRLYTLVVVDTENLILPIEYKTVEDGWTYDGE